MEEALRYVKPVTGEPMRFMVPSRTHRNAPYLVDLEENDFNGACGCVQFAMRLNPLIREPDWEPGPATQCWHILITREYFLRDMLVRVAAKMNRSAK